MMARPLFVFLRPKESGLQPVEEEPRLVDGWMQLPVFKGGPGHRARPRMPPRLLNHLADP